MALPIVLLLDTSTPIRLFKNEILIIGGYMNAVEIRRIGATNFVQTTRTKFHFLFTAETFLREKRKQYFIKKFHNFYNK